MKIVHICLCNPLSDGYNYQENILTKYHRRMGYDVTVITSQYSRNSKGEMKKINACQYINEDDVKIIRLQARFHANYRFRFKTYPQLLITLKKEYPEILFIHGLQFLDCITISNYLSFNKDVITYIDNHCDAYNSASNWFSKNILHRLIWKYCAHKIEPFVKKFYGVLPARVDFLVDLYKIPKERCDLLILGGDDDYIKQAKETNERERVRKLYSIKNIDFLIITGGKINKYRPEVINLMEAISQINLPEVKLLVFGNVSTEYEQRFNNLCDNKRIIYCGWLESKEIYSYFEAADIVVFPGLHSVLWEQALSQGKVCILRNINGFHHVDMGGNAEFINDLSVFGIKNILMNIIRNREKYNEMKRIAEIKSSLFSYKNIAFKSIS